MSQATEALISPADAKDRIIAALDVATATEARGIVNELKGHVGAFKIGSQLFTAAGPDIVREFVSPDVRIFLDLKFHDIPNTTAMASVEAARLGVWMLNVHTLGGREMMKRTVSEVEDVCRAERLQKPLIIGVTVLTSSDDEGVREVGLEDGVDTAVGRLAALAAESGLDGVVASPREVPLVRNAVKKPDFLVITPGIRADHGTDDDQRRVTTFRQAIANGSDYAVVGRPIIGSVDRRAAVQQMISN